MYLGLCCWRAFLGYRAFKRTDYPAASYDPVPVPAKNAFSRMTWWMTCIIGLNGLIQSREDSLSRFTWFHLESYMSRLLPLNGSRRLRRNVVNHPVDAANFVDNTVGNSFQQVVRNARPVSGHTIFTRNQTQYNRVSVGALVAHNTHTADGQQNGKGLPAIFIDATSIYFLTNIKSASRKISNRSAVTSQ